MPWLLSNTKTLMDNDNHKSEFGDVAYIKHFSKCHCLPEATYLGHYSDVIKSVRASQIIGVSIVCSAVCSDVVKNKTPKLRITGLCEGNPPWTVGFPSQRASNADNVSIWWRHLVTRDFAWWWQHVTYIWPASALDRNLVQLWIVLLF